MLADASVELQSNEPDSPSTRDNGEVCARYQVDIDADLGDVMRAGCEPTLAQMSALMDNPIGNVAMMFNQLDVYRMEEPESGTKENLSSSSMYLAIFRPMLLTRSPVPIVSCNSGTGLIQSPARGGLPPITTTDRAPGNRSSGR